MLRGVEVAFCLGLLLLAPLGAVGYDVCTGHRCDTAACPCGCECGSPTDPGLCFVPQTEPLPLVSGPNVNGIDLADPGLPAAQAAAVRAGFVDVTKAPFNADPTGATDATAALQAALDFGRAHYLVTFLPGGTYVVSQTLRMIQAEKTFMTTGGGAPNCNNMVEIFGQTPKPMPHCGRTQPYVLQGSTANSSSRAILLVKKATGLKGYVVQIHNPVNDNINMNQVMASVDVTIEAGNPNAMGVYARGAQGVSVQDVTIRAVDAAVGLDGGAGSGGSHAKVTVIGGVVGMRLSTAQPSPTLSGITLINQSSVALLYGSPGRQTLSVAGLVISVVGTAVAINTSNPLSLVDARLSCVGGGGEGGGCAAAIVTDGATNLYLRDVYFSGFTNAVVLRARHSNASMPVVMSRGAKWTHVAELAAGHSAAVPSDLNEADAAATTPRDAAAFQYSSPVYLNGVAQASALLVEGVDAAAPPADIASQHTWSSDFPSWETKGICNAKDAPYNAKGDLVTDDTKALQAMLDDPACSHCFLPKGYYALSSTLTMRPGQSLFGTARLLSNLVVHASAKATVAEGEAPWPLLETADGAATAGATAAGPNTIALLSLIVWHHVNATYAVHFRGATVWRRAHTNRVDLSPGLVGPSAYYNQPLNIMTGGSATGVSRFWNFYQENWNAQGPLYRHLLVKDTAMVWRCYHCNTEHSQGEANLEISGAKGAIELYGFKGEGNYVQIWVRDSSTFFLLGYGGNASPFPFHCGYPPGYAPYEPSLIRIERVANLRLVNLISQTSGQKETKCGLFDTGFAGEFYDPAVWRTVLEIASGGVNVSTVAEHWPILYRRTS